jgi:hypothetical protein
VSTVTKGWVFAFAQKSARAWVVVMVTMLKVRTFLARGHPAVTFPLGEAALKRKCVRQTGFLFMGIVTCLRYWTRKTRVNLSYFTGGKAPGL